MVLHVSALFTHTMNSKIEQNNVMKYVIIIHLLVVIFNCNLFSTNQRPDLIVIKGDTFKLYAAPLDRFFELAGSKSIPDYKGCFSTGCYRGYQATWLLLHDSLFLTRITSCCDRSDTGNLEKMFGNNYRYQKVFAYWCSDTVYIPFGDLIRKYDIGSPLCMHNYLVCFKEGKQIYNQSYTNYSHHEGNKDRIDYYEAWDYMYKYIKHHFQWSLLPKSNDNYISIDFDVIIDSAGKIGYYEWLGGDSIYSKVISQTLLNISPFDILKCSGSAVPESFRFRLEINHFWHRIYDMDLVDAVKEHRNIIV
jgi:hypothetical protein